MNALQRLVEQLKLEAGVERIKVRRAGTPFPRGAEAARSRPACRPRAASGEAGGRGRVAAEPAERGRGARPLERPRGVGRRGGSDAVGGGEDGAPGPGSLLGLAGPRRPLGWRRGLRGSRPGLVAREDRPVPARVVRDRVPLGASHFQWCGR